MRPGVCLVIPPSTFLLDERVFLTLGILKIAAVLEEAGYPIEMLDLSGVENFEEAAEHHAVRSSARFFGLTATTPQMPATRRVVEKLRACRPEARLILGGPHATLVHAAYRRECREGRSGRAKAALDELLGLFNVVVAGDGERAVFGALEDAAPRLIDADDRRSPLFLSSEELNRMPFPARHLVDVGSYQYRIDDLPATSLIAQLGCPFGCGFCGGRESAMLRIIRTRSADSVMAELMHLHEVYGFRGFMFYDDELNVSKEMVPLMNRVTLAQRQRGVEFALRGFVKSELFDSEQAEAMARAGFRWILVGFESGSPRILRNINKKATCEENTRCLRIAREHGLKVKALMSIGHPGESEATLRETRDWLLEVAPNDLDVTIITTYPGTPYYDQALPDPERPNTWVYTFKKTGDRLYAEDVDYTQVADYYKGRPEGGYRSFVHSDHLSAEELVEARDAIERDIRAALNIPYNPSRPSIRYEHSMGQFGAVLPPTILRTTSGRAAAGSREPSTRVILGAVQE